MIVASFFYFFIAIKSFSNPLGPNPIYVHSNEMKTKSNFEGYYACTFSGVRFQVFGTYDKNYTIYLDHKYYATVSFVPLNSSQPQYTSQLFPYGKHKIELMSSDSNFKITKIAYAQTSNRRIVNYADFTYNSNWREWTPSGTDIKTIYTHIDNEEIKATIRCSKFWIYGVKDSSRGIGTVKFGDILVDGFDQYSKESQYDLHVIYESPDFPLTNAELVIINTDDPSRAKTINFAYVEIQVEPAPYPVSDPISVSADAMQGRKDTDYIDACQEPGDENGPPCGEVAIPPSAGGKSMLLEYIFKGVRFQ